MPANKWCGESESDFPAVRTGETRTHTHTHTHTQAPSERVNNASLPPSCSRMARLLLLLLSLSVCRTGGGIDVDMEGRYWDWGSGLRELLHSFPAHSPFVTETPGHVANCTQRFWLPPSSPVCWEDIAGPEEFEKTRLLVLQNRAALHAVTEASGLEEGGVSYEQQAMTDVQGVREDHLSISQTVESMQKVFLDLDKKRKEGGGHDTFASIKERIANTTNSLNIKEEMATLLEQRLSKLERTLDAIQLRLTRLLN